MLEPLYDAAQDGLVEHQLLAVHHSHHVVACQQFAGLQYDAVGAGVEHVYPQLLVQDFACEDEHLHLGVQLLGLSAQLHADGGRTSQPQVEQHQLRQLLLEQSPVGSLVGCCAGDFGFGYVGGYDA